MQTDALKGLLIKILCQLLPIPTGSWRGPSEGNAVFRPIHQFHLDWNNKNNTALNYFQKSLLSKMTFSKLFILVSIPVFEPF